MAGDRHDDPDRGVTPGPVCRAVWVRLILFAVFVVVAVVVAVVVGLPDVEALRVDIAAAGVAAPVLFYAVATLAPLPKNVLSALAGVLFGLVPGVALVMLAALLGAAGAFGLGRLLGRGAVERFTGGKGRPGR